MRGPSWNTWGKICRGPKFSSPLRGDFACFFASRYARAATRQACSQAGISRSLWQKQVVFAAWNARLPAGSKEIRVELVFVTALVSVILTELSAAETQTQGPYTFRNARLQLFQTGIGSTGLRYCSRKFCKNDEDKIMTKTSSTLHTQTEDTRL